MNHSAAVISRSSRVAIGAALAMAMAATRLGHFEGVPDASWAVFFLGGIYLRGALGYLLLMLEAVGIDYLATQQLGVSSYCISAAYAFLPLAYGSLWFGGRLTGDAIGQLRLRSIGVLAASLLISSSLCFLISNGSFYWLSGRVGTASLSAWIDNLATWYAPFVQVPFLHVGAAVILHAAIGRLLKAASSKNAAVAQ